MDLRDHISEFAARRMPKVLAARLACGVITAIQSPVDFEVNVNSGSPPWPRCS